MKFYCRSTIFPDACWSSWWSPPDDSEYSSNNADSSDDSSSYNSHTHTCSSLVYFNCICSHDLVYHLRTVCDVTLRFQCIVITCSSYFWFVRIVFPNIGSPCLFQPSDFFFSHVSHFSYPILRPPCLSFMITCFPNYWIICLSSCRFGFFWL